MVALLSICSVIFIILNISSALQDSLGPAVCGSKVIRNSVKNFNKLKGCRVIEGHLSISLLERHNETDYDGMVFPELTEVTDYVLFFRVNGLKSLGKLFPNLRIIRGNYLLQDSSFIVHDLPHLEEIGLKSLLKIDRGSVWIAYNPALCFVETIDWSIITSGNKDNFFSTNKAVNECPICPNGVFDGNSTMSGAPIICPETAEEKRHCWNRSECQQICPPKCGNLTCNANGDCCDESCIECADNDTSQCLSCRYLTIGNGNARRCVQKCPANTYALGNSRCVTAEECHLQERPNLLVLHESPLLKRPYIAREDGECTIGCPSNYYPDGPSGERRCDKCGANGCKRECPSMEIDTYSSARFARGCTHITGDLRINVWSQDEHHLARELETCLSDIEVIEGALSITSSSLVSLGFFKKLRTVYGTTDKYYRFGLTVIGNPNLQALFPQNVTIEHGRTLFYSNPKLPMTTIEKLNENLNDSRVVDEKLLPHLNHDVNGIQCPATDIVSLIANVTAFSYNLAILELETLVYEDERTLLGYLLYYRPAPVQNVSMFNGRSGCGGDTWMVDDIEDNNRNHTTVTHILTRLKPDTQYAYYVRTYTFEFEQRTGLSPIQYFRTMPESTQQRNADASVDSADDNILPLNQNSGVNSTEEIIEKIGEESIDSKCNCIYADEKRSKVLNLKMETGRLIHFENALHNVIYLKMEDEEEEKYDENQ